MNCKSLTKAELTSTNGCGSSYWAAWIFRIPKWVSRLYWNCCNRHDIRYQEGKSLAQKQQADDELYDCMYYSAFHGPRWKRGFLLHIADYTYWCLNTRLSNKCFDTAEKGAR